MGILDRYAIIHCARVKVEPVKIYEKPKPEGLPILGDVRPITIAEISPVSMGSITAHRLKDYRHKSFSLMLLPEVHIMLDELLSEVDDIDKYDEFKSSNLER